MCNAWNHHIGCNCGWGGDGYSGSGNFNFHYSEFENYNRQLDIFKSNFSTTFPNAICNYCGEKIFFFQNIYGSKVFFDSLGKPWPKHKCYYQNDKKDEYHVILTLSNLPKINSDTPNNLTLERNIEPELLEVYLDDYKRISFINPTNKIKEEYLIKFPYSDFGICFKNKNNKNVTIEGYNYNGEYTLECFKIDKNFKEKYNHILVPKVGDTIVITLNPDNISEDKLRIYFYYPEKIDNGIQYVKKFILISRLKQGTYKLLIEKRELKINVCSKFTESGTTTFFEVD